MTMLVICGLCSFPEMIVSNGPHFLQKKKIEELVEDCSFLFLLVNFHMLWNESHFHFEFNKDYTGRIRTYPCVVGVRLAK